MTKAFFEVFSNLKIDESIKEALDEALVERIFINSINNHMIIHITLRDIVYPSLLGSIAESIKGHLNMPDIEQVIIKESYDFHEEMSFDALYLFYQRALGELIKITEPVCGVAIIKNEPVIEDHKVTYALTDQFYDYFTKRKIDTMIETIYEEKFGLSIEVKLVKALGQELIDEWMENRKQEEKIIVKEMASKARINQAISKPEKKVIPKKDNKKEDSTNLIIGRKPIVGETIRIEEIDGNTADVIIDCIVVNYEERDIKTKKLLIFDIYDLTSSITCKAFINPTMYDTQVAGNIKKNMAARISGRVQFDTYSKETVIIVDGMEPIEDFRKPKVDAAKFKRIELHAHTQMSDMDAVVSAKDLVNRAISYGHKAIAITDHGVVQAFPDAFHAAQGKDIKIIYGVEAYLVDDETPTVKGHSGENFEDTYVIFDLETTGFIPGKDRITEIGAVRIHNRMVVDRFSTFVNPERDIPLEVQKLTHITPDLVADAPLYQVALKAFLEFAGDSLLVAHNADFDMSFIHHFTGKMGIKVTNPVVDTLGIGRTLFHDMGRHRLNNLAKRLGVSLKNHHRAVYDAEATAEIFIKMMDQMDAMNIHNWDQYENYEASGHKNIGKMRPNHVILLTKNLVGLKNLYKLVSDAHMKYFFNQKPRIPKSLLRQMREGILVGSACEAGELYESIRDQKSREEIEQIAAFYDYYEVQPLGNNEYLVRNGKLESEEDLININKEIIALGKAHNKPVVATGDVHFMDPEDEIYRRVLMGGKGFEDADYQPPLYFRTTHEMLDEFFYLDDVTAYEVVVENPNIIADLIEAIEPVPPDKYPPIIEGSEEELRKICYDKAHEIYGPTLPEIVVARLERELNSIISNGFAVMYIIAQKLVWKSNEDGYLVGSRGSVGSSFAATMAGITEVNPLSAHYICPKCYYSDFDSQVIKAHSGNSGCDLPDMDCPNCGEKLAKEGHDIPFETFLGFHGDKEPDIDLNFSGDYQGKAHAYTEELFGKGHVFRAGTIGTLAEKTAYGFVKKYFDEREMTLTKAEMNRLVAGCTGVRRTTGQHPGGIIVVPKSEEIYTFTPIQRPANDVTSNITTTHFDYHSIDHNLLKLDILGHDDPTMIRMLEDLTGVDAQSIPLDEPKVMSLFGGLDALGINPRDIDQCELGALGIPEFGTEFVIQMLMDTKPKSFSDLVRISGLSHGTDVWLNNAQELIRDNTADITEIISTRDDIMTYLIHMGMDSGLAFTIMEAVRKGKGLKPEWEVDMKANNVPEWYIWSCNQIKYMFPKAHAVAYVMMAYRIAYFKVYYPLAYYTAFYSIRASNFDYEIMCHGKEHLEGCLKDLKQKLKDNDISNKEKDMIKDMKIVQEMYARGFSFQPIDLYAVDSTKFQIINGKIMPALSAIQGLGEKAAESIVQVRKAGPFLSVEDLVNRSKISKTVVEVMKNNQILAGMQDTNQIDLFSLLD